MSPTVVEIVTHRTNAHIDPTLHIWGWEVPVYLFLGGLVAGIMVLTAAMELTRKGARPASTALRWMPLAGLVAISLGMGALFLDLEYKAHVYRFYTSFEWTSPMSWGSWLLLLVYPALLLFALGSFTASERESLTTRRPLRRLSRLTAALFAFADRHRRAIVWTTLTVGIGLGAYTGLLLGTMAARPAWNSGVLAPLFLVSGISTGAALMMLFRLDTHEAHTLVRWDIAAIIVELVLLAVLLLGWLTGNAMAQEAAAGFLGGPWTPWFWSVVVLGGLLVPLTLELLEVRRRVPATVLAPLLILAGGFALRAIVVAAGQLTNYSNLG